MKFYLAGPMRGYADNNFPMFDRVAAHLRATGDDIVSPAEHDREAYGTHDNAEQHLKELILWDLAAVVDCDGVVLLPGWEKSHGARVEHALALFLGLEVWEFDASTLPKQPGDQVDSVEVGW